MIETIQKIRAAFPNAVLNETFFRDEYSLTIQLSSLREICLHARNVLGFNYLIDVSSVDHFGEEPRFEMVYELYSMRDRIHLRLKATVSEDDCQAPTVSDIWPTADWHEREVYDMMGIRFVDHPDLRRILMWEGFPTTRCARIFLSKGSTATRLAWHSAIPRHWQAVRLLLCPRMAPLRCANHGLVTLKI